MCCGENWRGCRSCASGAATITLEPWAMRARPETTDTAVVPEAVIASFTF
jgi:hypothetical protein